MDTNTTKRSGLDLSAYPEGGGQRFISFFGLLDQHTLVEIMTALLLDRSALTSFLSTCKQIRGYWHALLCKIGIERRNGNAFVSCNPHTLFPSTELPIEALVVLDGRTARRIGRTLRALGASGVVIRLGPDRFDLCAYDWHLISVHIFTVRSAFQIATKLGVFLVDLEAFTETLLRLRGAAVILRFGEHSVHATDPRQKVTTELLYQEIYQEHEKQFDDLRFPVCTDLPAEFMRLTKLDCVRLYNDIVNRTEGGKKPIVSIGPTVGSHCDPAALLAFVKCPTSIGRKVERFGGDFLTRHVCYTLRDLFYKTDGKEENYWVVPMKSEHGPLYFVQKGKAVCSFHALSPFIEEGVL